MQDTFRSAPRYQTIAFTLLRLVAGFLMIQHGCQKILGLLGGFGGAGHTAPLMSLYGAAGLIELVGPLFLIPGLFSRPAAFILSGEMAFAYFIGHFPRGFWTVQNHGEPAVLYCFIFLLIAAVGAGPFSLDALLAKRAGKKKAVGAGAIAR